MLELADTLFGATHWFDPHVAGEIPCAIRHDSLEGLLAVSNVVSLHVPLNAETQAFIDYARIASMPAPRVLVNVARGGLVVQADLQRALADGTLFGAGMDVFAAEPLDAASPLLGFPNLAVSPTPRGLPRVRCRTSAGGRRRTSPRYWRDPRRPRP